MSFQLFSLFLWAHFLIVVDGKLKIKFSVISQLIPQISPVSKLPLVIGLIGKFIYSAMIVVNTLNPSWPVEYIIYTATIPSAFSGADVAIFASAFSYISDITSLNDRTMRITILDVCYLSTMPTGVYIGIMMMITTN